MAGLALTDRREHREAIPDLLDSVRASMSRRLVFEGEVGAGKTALLGASDLALYTRDQAEYAVTDAVIARADADQTAATS